MKIRKGFVSNSSSSSFVILLPENFLDIVDYKKITDEYEDFPLDGFKELLKRLVDDGGFYNEEIYDYSKKYDKNHEYDFFDNLNDVISAYVIATVEGGPDDGQIVVADSKKITELLNKKS